MFSIVHSYRYSDHRERHQNKSNDKHKSTRNRRSVSSQSSGLSESRIFIITCRSPGFPTFPTFRRFHQQNTAKIEGLCFLGFCRRKDPGFQKIAVLGRSKNTVKIFSSSPTIDDLCHRKGSGFLKIAVLSINSRQRCDPSKPTLLKKILRTKTANASQNPPANEILLSVENGAR